MTLAEVRLWGRTIGAVSLEDGKASWRSSTIRNSSAAESRSLLLPSLWTIGPHVFPELSRRTFHGLPGLLADSLPDTFGNALIDASLATKGERPTASIPWNGCATRDAVEWERWSSPRPWATTEAGEKVEIDALVSWLRRFSASATT